LQNVPDEATPEQLSNFSQLLVPIRRKLLQSQAFLVLQLDSFLTVSEVT